MPRDVSGNYSLPAGTTGVVGALADVTKVNSRFSDLEAALNDPLLKLLPATDKVPYFTGSGSAGLATFLAAARSLIALPAAANKMPYYDSATTAALADLTAFGRSLAALADVAALRSLLGFSQGLGASGSITLPGGLTFQWLTSTVIGSGVNSVQNLPTAYSSANFGALTSYVSTSGNANVGDGYIGQVRALGLSSVTIRNLGPASAQFFCLSLGI